MKTNFSPLTRTALVAGFYFIGGWIGHMSQFPSGVDFVAPAAGIALAAILLNGPGFWPAVVLGSFFFSLLTRPITPVVILTTMVANTMGAIVCSYLLERFVKFSNSMERVRDVAGFVGLACLLGTIVNAAFDVVGLCYTGLLPWDDLFFTLLQWWVPNAMAVLIVTPVVITWASPSFIRWNWAMAAEATLCSIGLAIGTTLSFGSWYVPGLQSYPLAYLPYPFLVWGALRFGQRGATVGTLVVSSLAIYALLRGWGPFYVEGIGGEGESLMLLGTYIGVIAITNMLLAAAATERRVAEDAARKSEAMFLLISENVGDLIAVTGASGKRLYNSPCYAKILGYPEHLVGTNAFEQIHPEDRQRVRNVFRDTIRTGVGQRLEYRFLLKDGTIRYIESLGNYVPGDRREEGKVVSISRDITDRKRDEETLRLLASAVKFADDSIVITTAELDLPGPTIVFVNPGFTRITGYTAEEVMGKSPRILQGPKTDRAVLDQLRTGLSAGEKFHGETINYRKDGSEYYNEWHIEPIKDDKGVTTHYLGVQRDVTSRKQIEADLARARDAALAAAKHKAEFLANMSHEIRTPMNGVIGMTNLLLRTTLTVQQRDFTETIRRSADSLLSIINDILDFSKIEAGKLVLEEIDFTVNEAIESSLELLAEKAHSKNIEIAGWVEEDVPARLRGDMGRLRQVITNLLSNAVKFTENGEVSIRVSKLSHTEQDVLLKFEITDTGIGIPGEAQKRLFQSFSQADGSTTRKYGGTGLGLAICKQLSQAMGGDIGIESVPGQGSTFWFTVRLQVQNGVVDTPSYPEIEGQRILVVDDSALSIRVMLRYLQSTKAFVETAAGGKAALEKLFGAANAGKPFALALIDQQMPEVDGSMLARAIKSDPRVADTKILLLTTFIDAISAAHSGVRDYLTKPLKETRLIEAVSRVLRGLPIDSEAHAPPETGAGQGSKNTVPLRILVAEDNITNQKVALSQLECLGYSPVDAVANGLEVLSAIQKVPYDVIFMDCQMPEMDGYEATRRIRALENLPGYSKRPLHIIAMTANAMQGDREECLAAGMNDYVSKPVEEELLQAVLDHYIATLPAPPVVAQEGAVPSQTTRLIINSLNGNQERKVSDVSEQITASIEIVPDDKPPVDMIRLKRITQSNAKRMRDIAALYISEANQCHAALKAAIEAKSAEKVHQVAHKWAGASLTSGMSAVVPSLRELEKMGREGSVDSAPAQYEIVTNEFARVRGFLNTEFKLDAPA